MAMSDSWENPVSGDWSDAADWSSGALPGSNSAVTIGVSGTYTVTLNSPAEAASLTLSDKTATLYVDRQLSVSGDIALHAGELELGAGGIIADATVQLSGGSVAFTGGSAEYSIDGVTYPGGTLSDVIWQGELVVGSTGVTITDGITLENAAGTGPGYASVGYGGLDIVGTTTLNSATIELGGDLSSVADDAAAVLTFGSGLNLLVDGGGAITLVDGGAFGDGIVNDGSITVSAADDGEFDVFGNSFTNNGSVAVYGNDDMLGIDSANVSNSGSLTLADGGCVTMDSATIGADSGTINFGSTADYENQLNIGNTMPGDTIDGFGPGDFIDMAIAYDPAGTPVLGANNVLQFTDDGQTYDLKFDPTQSFTGEEFVLRDLWGDTLLTMNSTACYCRGTMILTDRGEIPVEELRIGDPVVTISGEAKPICWIGCRSYRGRFAANNREVLPVRFKAGSLADDVPRRELSVSPLHAMFIDGVLIPAQVLVNGSSITQADAIELVEYFHIELAQHDVILAEGAASETFVDDGSRGMFLNAAEYGALYPDAVREPARYCAPRVEDGEELEAVRRRIAARSSGTGRVSIAARIGAPEQTAGGPLRGVLELVRHDLIEGWAQNEQSPDAPVSLLILDNGVTVAQVVADRYRHDLAQAGIGDGRHSFSLAIPGGLGPDTRHLIRVQRVEDGCELLQSPRVVEAIAGSLAPQCVVPANLARHGKLELASRDLIEGWAWDEQRPDEPVALQILNQGEVIARVLANRHRPDLAAAGVGGGRHAFQVRIPGGLSPLSRHTIEVRVEADGSVLPGSPVVIEASTSFDATLEHAIETSVAALGTVADQDRALSFLAAQTERLLRLRAQTEGGLTARVAYEQFRRRWGGGAAPLAEPGLRALVIDAVAPLAGRDGGSQAVLSHMRALQTLGYGLSFASPAEIAALARAGLEAAGISVCATPFYSSVEDVLRCQAGCFDVVYLHRVAIATNYLALARQYCPKARIIYSVADLHHVRLARQSEIEERPELLAVSRRVRMQELTAAWSADAVITHSVDEAALLRQAVPAANVHVVPWEVPRRTGSVPFARRAGLAFIGSYDHAPNLDAAGFLAEVLMPLIWRDHPEIECLLVGSGMPARMRGLARPGLVAQGEVSDLAEVFDRVRLTVAPLRFGAGLKGKVLESLGAGVPCVMSRVAAEGMVLPAALSALVADGADALAVRIATLHGSAAQHQAAAAAGVRLIAEGFTANRVAEALSAAIGLRATARSASG